MLGGSSPGLKIDEFWVSAEAASVVIPLTAPLFNRKKEKSSNTCQQIDCYKESK